jgi:hypothetical protein
MKQIIPSALVLSLVASQAMALSCVQPDAARSFETAANSDKTFVILSGTFEFAARPEVTTDNPRAENYLSKFSGLLLTGVGFTDQVAAPVTINTSCAASWCGTMKPGTPYLAFVEQTETRLTLNVGPCPEMALQNPTQEVLDKVVACAQGKDCKPES